MSFKKVITPLITLCLFTACSSDKVVEEVEEIKPIGEPIRFTCKLQENASATRAAALEDDFLLSAYKSFQQSGQQTVMDDYHIQHTTSGSDWDGNVSHNWQYVGVDGQIERYWDNDGFPYRFNAVAPYTTNSSAISMTDTKVDINATYKMQTWNDGEKTNADDREAEPYWVAQVQRGADGKDTDMITGSNIPNASSTALNRYVAVPFHHLNSKIRFALYTTSAWATAHPMYIEDFSIKVVSDDFVTEAGKYSATGTAANQYSWYNGTGNSGFSDLTKATAAGTELLHYSGVDENHLPLEGNDLSKWQSKATAFWFDAKAKDGLMQIPQDGVKLTVSMNLYLIDGDDVLVFQFTDVPVKLALDGAAPTETHHWQSGNIYTYYLIIDNVGEMLQIDFTATLTPWEDLSGSLVTDIEQ